MIELDKKYPQYGFRKNKGYGTKDHLEALKKYGYVKGVHRLTFEPIKSMVSGEEQLELF
jgi:ribonuclease HII